MEIFATDYKMEQYTLLSGIMVNPLVQFGLVHQKAHMLHPRWVQTGDTDGDGLGEVLFLRIFPQIDSVGPKVRF
ncbi:MAG: hypothetical protein CM1200mP1_07160 [Candidatus Neomarinimicrobiota bacterium]|nr:MAG: hypothetical protein CM1200mP1_07160 [Candidatus Neomarinimicrobiota bacterium]